MSRHSLQPLAGLGAVYEVAIGWDRALATYFVIVFGVPDDDGRGPCEAAELLPLVWEGTAPGALPTPEAAVDLAAAYATIPEGLAAQLANDREAEPASVADPASHAFLAAFSPKANGRP